MSRVPPCGQLPAKAASPSAANTALSAKSIVRSLLEASNRDVQRQSWILERGSHSRRLSQVSELEIGEISLWHRGFCPCFTSAVIGIIVTVTGHALKGHMIMSLWDTGQGLHSLLAAQQQSQSHHINFTPWAVSCCSNDENVCNLISIPCTPARAFFPPISLLSSWERGNHLHLVELSPGRVTTGVDFFLITWISKSSLAFISSLQHGSVISSA